jgi:hypothetical protein
MRLHRSAVPILACLALAAGCEPREDSPARDSALPAIQASPSPAPGSSIAAPESADAAPIRPASSGSLYPLLATGGDSGFVIGPGTSEAELIAAYGAANVGRADVSVGEGDVEPATILFPGDSTRRLEVHWTDAATRTAPSRVRAWQHANAWTIGSGVTLGSTLAEVERRNGRPFTMAGFGFDYEGTSISWEGGQLDSLPPGVERVIVRLRPTARGKVTDDEWAYVSGDRELRSDDWIVKRTLPAVYSLEVWFGR